MGGDGGFAAPIAAGFLIPWFWIGMLRLMDLDLYEAESIPVIVTTTFVAQLVTYHLSASFFDDAAVKHQSSSIFNLSFGITPTDGGASLGLGFQF